MSMWARLQVRMMLSYVVVSVITALLLELLLILAFVFVIGRLPFIDQNSETVARGSAQVYALEAAALANGGALAPDTMFQPGHPSSLAAPQETTANSPQVAFVLLIAPDGKVLASSDPKHYPLAIPIARELSDRQQLQLGLDALKGRAGSAAVIVPQGHIASAAQPVLHRRQVIGAVYVQMQPVSLGGFLSFAPFWLATALFWLVTTAPVGAIFGVLTTRSLVRRLHRLARVTTQFAQGDYSQRVPISRQDEIGQLERRLNEMAGQLVTSIAQQKALTEQHARLEERARIEQELRTAQDIQRALLPKEAPVLPGWHWCRCTVGRARWGATSMISC